MSFIIKTTNRFEKDLSRCIRRGYAVSELKKVIELLEKDGSLPVIYRPHKLKGEKRGLWECHIKPDWLLVWEQNDNELTILLMLTGTHSDIF